MKNTVLKLAMTLAVMAICLSCSKIVLDEEQDDTPDKPANSTLIVTASSRATSTETGDISYPVSVYVFNSNGKCVDLKTIASADDQLSFKLSAGTYDVYAVAGATSDCYDLPTQAEATKQSVITLKAGKENCDLMTAATTGLTLQANEENTLELNLERKVLMIQTVTMKNIPTDVEEVTVSISPLYTTLLLNGSYGNETGSASISLAKGDDASTWTNSAPVFFYVSKDAPSITVSMKRTGSDAVKSYTYSLKEAMQANYKFNITGTYDGDKITVAGVISGVKWIGTSEISFNFGDDTTGSSEEATGEETENGKGGGETSDIPAAGTAYKGCYVLKVDKTVSPVAVTLMSPTNNNTWSFTTGNEEELKADVDNALSKISVEGVSDWRLPTKDEIAYAYDNMDTIYENVNAIKQTSSTTTMESLFSNGAYLFNNNGTINSYIYSKDGNYTIKEINDIGNGKSTYLRAFTTIYFNE